MANDRTDSRRVRMRELWIRNDRQIAEILIEEGFSTATPRTPDAKRKQLEAMRLCVFGDRRWWKKQWRTAKDATKEETHETRGEHLATLDSYQAIGVDILTDLNMRATPRVQALIALARIQEARAKATGVAEVAAAPPEGENAVRIPFLGVVVGLDQLTPAAMKKIRKWRDGGSNK
jgi:hypothetical protein